MTDRSKSDYGKIVISLHKSVCNETFRTKATVAGLGLRKIGQVRELVDTPSVRGMIKKVMHCLYVKQIKGQFDVKTK
jgi:large subunit ribosomal protein L30